MEAVIVQLQGIKAYLFFIMLFTGWTAMVATVVAMTVYKKLKRMGV